MTKLSIGCHVSAAGGVFNAPKNAAELGCETFQIFTRPPMGGKAPELTKEIVARFKEEMEKYYPQEPSPRPSPKGGGRLGTFVVHCPYIVNLGSAKPRIYHGTLSIMGEELKRGNMLGAKYVMTHLGSFKDLGREKGMAQAQKGLVEVLKKYEGSSTLLGTSNTKFLLEIAAGSGEVIGASFEVLAELMEPLLKFKTFGGICFDTQHAFASGYDLRDDAAVASTFKLFDKIIGLKYLKMSHINDSKIDFGGKKDRHDHIGYGKIGEAGFEALLRKISNFKFQISNPFPLIFETEHDKVKEDIKILKKLRNKIKA